MRERSLDRVWAGPSAARKFFTPSLSGEATVLKEATGQEETLTFVLHILMLQTGEVGSYLIRSKGGI